MNISKREYEMGKILRCIKEDDFSCLANSEMKVLEIKYGLKDEEYKSLDKVSVILNLSRERIHQIEEKAIRKLKTYINEN
ncbi:MAG: hypothetical protein IJ565_05635 [Bacilli bacterium]|nr:hypothetical protein [Bacilli bacterium]